MNAPAPQAPQARLAPLETLYDAVSGATLSLPPELASVYGAFRLPAPAQHPDRPHVIGNFVTTLDGVVALNTPGYMSGGAISGNNAHDRMVMGLLRAVADAVVVGAGTLRSVPDHLWTAAYIYPALAGEYQALRARLGKPPAPLNVIVTAHGELDPRLPVFQSHDVPVLVVTTAAGMPRIRAHDFPDWVRIVEIGASADPSQEIGAREILEAVCTASQVHSEGRPCQTILVEGGPKLMSRFFAEHCLNELFLTLAPQVAGRDNATVRPGFVDGKRFAPEHPVWGTLVDVRRGGSHLFLRYAFLATDESVESIAPTQKEA